jgi:histidinol-phosphatase (PHP family)
MEEMIQKGIALGLKTMCFTEHQDYDYPDSPDGPGSMFLLNTDSYLYDLASLKEKYKGQIRLLFGVELGLQPHLMRQNAVYAKSYEFDFIIASSHICSGKDPYYPAFFEGRSEEEAYREYFTSVLENAKKFSNFDVYGHLDYVVRYGANMDRDYSYEKYRDILDAILELLLEKGKGIELNTGGIKKGMKDFHPCMDILKRYRSLGGEIITIGSDSHDAGHIADHFDRACEVLKECGFQYYTVFEKRNPEYIRL